MPLTNLTNFQKLKDLVLFCGDDANKELPCVEWLGSNWVNSKLGTRVVGRLAWIIANGPITDGYTIFRMCGGKRCVRPSHLRCVNGRETLKELLASIPEDPDVCVEWPLARDTGGYGSVSDGKGGTEIVSRAAWELVNGPIAEGFYVCHKCDNPPCFRPSHLFLGTAAENTSDAVYKGRLVRGEAVTGAKLTEERVKEIKRIQNSGVLAYRAAKSLGLNFRTVLDIYKGKTWKHVNI